MPAQKPGGRLGQGMAPMWDAVQVRRIVLVAGPTSVSGLPTDAATAGTALEVVRPQPGSGAQAPVGPMAPRAQPGRLAQAGGRVPRSLGAVGAALHPLTVRHVAAGAAWHGTGLSRSSGLMLPSWCLTGARLGLRSKLCRKRSGKSGAPGARRPKRRHPSGAVLGAHAVGERRPLRPRVTRQSAARPGAGPLLVVPVGLTLLLPARRRSPLADVALLRSRRSMSRGWRPG